MVIAGIVSLCVVALTGAAFVGMYVNRSKPNESKVVAQNDKMRIVQQTREVKQDTTDNQDSTSPRTSLSPRVNQRRSGQQQGSEISAPSTRGRQQEQDLSEPSFAVPGTSSSSPSVGLSSQELTKFVDPRFIRLDIKMRSGGGFGSGFFVTADGVAVTNFHVMEGAISATAMTVDKKKSSVQGFYYVDQGKDIAVIQIDATKHDVKPLPMSEELPEKGEAVAAFGAPLGFSFSSSGGVVSSIRAGSEIQQILRELSGQDIYKKLGFATDTTWIQTTAAISGGNSGGPLVNMRGELVGVNTWTTPIGQNLNFASTVDEVKMALDVASRRKLKPLSQLPVRRGSSPRIAQRPGNSTPGRTRPDSRIRPGGFPNIPGLPPGIHGLPPGFPGFSDTSDLPNRPRRPKPKPMSPEERKAYDEKRNGVESIEAIADKKVFSNSNGNAVREFATGSRVVDLQISQDQQFLAATTKDGELLVFDLKKGGRHLYSISSKHKLLRCARFSAQPAKLYTLRDNGGEASVRVRDIESGEAGKRELSLKTSRELEAGQLAISSDGRSIFATWTTPRDRGSRRLAEAKFWRIGLLDEETTSWNLERVFGRGSREPTACVFSPDNRYLVTGFNDGWISSATGAGNQIGTDGSHQVHNGKVFDIAISNDNKKIVSGGEDARLVVTSGWMGRRWRPAQYGKGGVEVLSVAISSDDKWIAAARADNRIEIWSLENRSLLAEFDTDSICTQIEFMGKNRFIIAAEAEGGIKIYKRPSIQE